MYFLTNIKNKVLGILLTHKFSNTKSIKLGSIYGSKSFMRPKNQVRWLISGGVGEDISFDIEFYNLNKCKLLLIDPTKRSRSHIENVITQLGCAKRTNYSSNGTQPVESYDLTKLREKDIYFINKALYSDKYKKIALFPPVKESYVSYSILNPARGKIENNSVLKDVVSFKSLINDYHLVDSECIVKLDIEGSEKEVIESMFKENFFPQQIIVEIDELYINFFKYYRYARKIINIIYQNNYTYFANDHAFDLCFVRK